MDLLRYLEAKGDAASGGGLSGEDPEYDPEFTAMELAAQPGEEVVIGDQVTPATDPEYREVEAQARAVLENAHDIRAAVFLSDAILHSTDEGAGLLGFAQATGLIRGMLEQFWDSCHPMLDEDDGDPIMRINAVQDLCGQPGGMGGPSPVYRSLRRAALTDSRGFGRFGLREIEIAEGHASLPADMDHVPDSATIGAAFQASEDDWLAAQLAAVEAAEADVRAISKCFDDNTPGQGPELDPLIKLLRQMGQKLRAYSGAEAGSAGASAEAPDGYGAGAPEGGVAPVATAPGAPGAPVAPGAINSPADVTAAIDRIIAYYRRAEPSSPVPLLLERAKRLVGADFLTIVNDMAPRGLENVQIVGGIDDEDD